LRDRGHEAEVHAAHELHRLDGWDAVVLGCAVRYGAWSIEMTDAVTRLRAQLATVPHAIFTVHMQALDDSAASRAQRTRYTAPIRALLNSKSEAFFAGVIEPARLGWFARLAVRLTKAPVGDRRDWARIRAWAESLDSALLGSCGATV
jgi:menaquinone-dependent protoporphyrinogen oxidase